MLWIRFEICNYTLLLQFILIFQFTDYFDGVRANSDRSPPGPLGPWWRAVWERDFPILQELGVNTVRVYNFNPITKTFLNKFPNEFTGTVTAYAAEHSQFLDHAQRYGMQVMVPAVTDQAFLMRSDIPRIARFVEAIVDELGNHDALLMWAVTNEIDLRTDPELLEKVNFAMDYLRNYTLQRWNRLIPCTAALVDNPEDYEFYAQYLKVDVFTTNAGYRSVDFGPLFDGETDSIGWKALSSKYNLPLLIGESGMHQVGDAETLVRPNWVNQQYKQILDRVQDGCVGLVYFEYSDEPLKPLYQQTMGFVNFTAARDVFTRRWSTEPDVWVPDRVIRKPIVFQALKGGLEEDTVFGRYHFNVDEFSLLNRNAETISVSGNPTNPTTPQPSIPRIPDEGGQYSNSGSLLLFASSLVMMLLLL